MQANRNTAPVPVLEASHRFEMPAAFDGSFSSPTLQFSDLGGTLMVAQPVRGYGVMGWVLWHAPTVGVAAVVLGFVLGVAVLVRAARRRQQRGQYYCVVCNYDLTGPGGMPPEAVGGPERCPECGSDLRRKRARQGRNVWTRVRWPLAGCAGAVVVGAAALRGTLERPGPMGWGWGVPWMPKLTSTLGLRSLVHADWKFEGPMTATVLQRWALRGGGTERSGDRRVLRDVYQVSFNDDGSHVVFSRHGLVTGNVGVLRLTDGVEFHVALPGSPARHHAGAAPSRDPGRVYVAGSVPTTPGARVFQQEVFEVDLQTRTTRLAGAIEVVSAPGDAQLLSANPEMREVDGTLRWGIYTTRGAAGAATEAAFHLPDGRSVPIPIAGNAGQAELSADGERLMLVEFGPGALSRLDVSLADGTATSVPVASGWVSNESAGGLRVLVGAMPGGGTPGLQVVDRAGVAVADLQLPAGMAPGGPVAISLDGQWAAAACTRTVTGWTGAMEMEVEVVVWELEGL